MCLSVGLRFAGFFCGILVSVVWASGRRKMKAKSNKNGPAENLGARIRKLRTERGYTQDQLAEILGIAKSMVSYYENDKVDLKRSMLEDVARALGTSVTFLLEEDGEKAEETELLDAFRRLSSAKFRRAAIRGMMSLVELEE